VPRPKIFIDANVIIQAGKPLDGPIMSRIKDLVKAELIEVLTTDLTIAEVAKKHTVNDYEVIKEIGRPHFRKLVSEHIGTNLPGLSKVDLRATISKKYTEQVTAIFKGLKAKVLPIDDVKPSAVFEDYGNGNGFFSGEGKGKGKGKKHQFPDAFIFECLKAEASVESPIIIVSDDGDFDVPVESAEHISLLKTVPELFKELGLQVEAPEIEGFLEENEDALLDLVDCELKDWTLDASDVEDATIEVNAVTSVEPSDLISFGSLEEGGNILIVGTVKINAEVYYSHPDWDTATYDSEDRRLIPWDEVSGETYEHF
jgi:predicted nucleic acid-binding protein